MYAETEVSARGRNFNFDPHFLDILSKIPHTPVVIPFETDYLQEEINPLPFDSIEGASKKKPCSVSRRVP